MKIESKPNCPINNFQPCRELECAWFMKVSGSNPNTGADVDDWGCAMAWFPVFTIENSQQQRQTSAAVESFRDEMIKSNEITESILGVTQTKRFS